MVKRIAATFVFILISLSALGLTLYCRWAKEHRNADGLLLDGEYVISVYDGIMRAVGAEEGVDWRLLSAIAHTESHFRPDVVSHRGAVGLMQIMPHIGEHFGIAPDDLGDPATNIRAAAMLLDEIDSMVRIPETVPLDDELSIVLACYNGGLGHVSDARRLARAHGEDMNSWEVVARYLSLKNDPEFYEHEVVSYGQFSGSRQTIAYVRNVMKRYKRYCRMTDAAETAAVN